MVQITRITNGLINTLDNLAVNESQQATAVVAEDDQVFIATVTDIYNRTGAGGDVIVCKATHIDTGKSILRSARPIAIL